MSEPEKRVGVYETGDGRTIHLGKIVLYSPATPILFIPPTREEFNAILRHARWHSITRNW